MKKINKFERNIGYFTQQLGTIEKVLKMYGFNDEEDLREELVNIQKEQNNDEIYFESGMYEYVEQEINTSLDLTSNTSYVDFGGNINPTSEITILGWINISDEYSQRTYIEKCDQNDNKLLTY